VLDLEQVRCFESACRWNSNSKTNGGYCDKSEITVSRKQCYDFQTNPKARIGCKSKQNGFCACTSCGFSPPGSKNCIDFREENKAELVIA